MKPKFSKELIVFIILIPLFLGFAFFISEKAKGMVTIYSVQSKEKKGTSIFFETLQRMKGAETEKMAPIESYDKKIIQVVLEAGSFDINQEEVQRWVAEGGTLVYLQWPFSKGIGYGTKAREINDVIVY